MFSAEKEMVSSFEDAEALENSMARLYGEYSRRISYPKGKYVMRFLMDAEKGHLNFLKVQESNFLQGRKILSKLSERPFRESGKAFNDTINTLEGDITLLESAEALEKADVQYYRLAVKKARAKDAKALFETLKSLEFAHLSLISKTIKSAREEGMAITSVQPKVLFSSMVRAKR